MPVWPIASRAKAAGLSVRCRRLSLSGSSRDFGGATRISQRSSPTVRPISSGKATPDVLAPLLQGGQDRP